MRIVQFFVGVRGSSSLTTPTEEGRMSVKTSSLSIKWDIWETEYTVRDYGTHIIVTAPWTRWDGNTGTLDTHKVRVDNTPRMALIRGMVDRGELVTPDSTTDPVLTMQDVLDGYGG